MGKKKKKLKRKIRELESTIEQLKVGHSLPTRNNISGLNNTPQLPNLHAVAGVSLATERAGIKSRQSDRTDLMLAVINPLVAVAGVFTKSATRSAAVLDCEAKLAEINTSHLPLTQAALLVNSGNANAFTGQSGFEGVREIVNHVSHELNISCQFVFTSSTGVIGEHLPIDVITPKIRILNQSLAPNHLARAAESIMTTDTIPKGASVRFDLNGVPITLTGIAKGSGMIAPDMATMLAYIFTDANIHQDLLQRLVTEINETTFNSITVDGDTSTSDTLMVFATGEAGNNLIEKENSKPGKLFSQALTTIMESLARQIVLDGEGATKFIEINVSGAENANDAQKVAQSIANSPLVKTAVSGEDANWGRIIMAVGKSGAHADRDKLKIWFGDLLVAENGCRSQHYCEESLSQYMREKEIIITVDLGLGSGSARVWTCDFSYGYIAINADYRS